MELGGQIRRTATPTGMIIYLRLDSIKQMTRSRRTQYQQQQHELSNSRGRTWSYHECTLILTLILGIMLHYGETPTQSVAHSRCSHPPLVHVVARTVAEVA